MTWPPTTDSPFENTYIAKRKPGNFFTVREASHPAYVLFRSLAELGWTWRMVKGTRHWIEMTKGDGHITVSLFGQGSFGARNKHGRYDIGLEDGDLWADALPHIAAFMAAMKENR